jgi:hypothetical protein
MILTRLKVVGAVVAAVGLAGTGAGVLTANHLAAAQPSAGLAARADDEKKDDKDENAEADRKTVMNSLKQIAVAMHNYESAYARFPASAVYDKDGQALLSWRVVLLPYLEEGDLYNEFHLDEAWDSDHNKKLLEKMPKLYVPVRGKPKEKHSTYYQVFTGNGAMFDGTQGPKIADITDGTSNTLLVVEAAEAVPWSKPVDLKFDPDKDLPKLGGHFKKGFYAAFADGAVHHLRDDYDAKTMKAAITRAGGEIYDLDLIHEKP